MVLAGAGAATATRWHIHVSLSLRLGHTAGRVLGLSRTFGARTLTMAQGKSDLPFHLEVREIMDPMLSGSCWTPPRLAHRPVHRW